MAKLNYFTDEFSEYELKNYFYSLDGREQKSELENFINQYLDLSKEEQLKYVKSFLTVCETFVVQIDKTVQKKILETLNKIPSNNLLLYNWYDFSNYLFIYSLLLFISTKRIRRIFYIV